MIRSIEAELFKLLRRPSSWLSIAGLAALPLLLGLFLRLAPAQGPEGAAAPMDGYVLMLVTVSTAMLFFAPLVSAFIGAELLAREVGDGVLKLSFVRPVSRVQVLLAKCLACLAHNVALMAGLWLVALAVGGALFHFGPPGPLMSAAVNVGWAGGDTSAVGEVSVAGVMGQGEALLRLAATYGYLALSLTVVGLLAILWSTVIRNAAGVVVATLAVLLGMGMLERAAAVRPYLLSAHLVSQSLLVSPADWAGLARSLGVLAVYAGVFVTGAVLIFSRSDIGT